MAKKKVVISFSSDDEWIEGYSISDSFTFEISQIIENFVKRAKRLVPEIEIECNIKFLKDGSVELTLIMDEEIYDEFAIREMIHLEEYGGELKVTGEYLV